MQYLRHDTRADFSGKKIVIDPGRGGGDTGANENDDKDKNLQEGTSLFITLGGQLAAGASILMTRDKDISVSQDKRDSIAGDIFISIHGMGGKKEEEIVIGKPTRENKKFACLLSRETGIKTIKQQDDKYIRNNPSSIAVSLYIGPGKFANSIANAVRSYYV
jgi:N-acetylmuramoyl-L-alanine amidase